MKEKLEKLDSISHVEVSKVDDLFGARNGAHTYLVTFAAVLRRTISASGSGRMSMTWSPSRYSILYGSDAEVEVLQGGYDPITGNTTPVWTGARRGKRGAGGGAAFVYSRSVVSSNDPTYMWSPEFALKPNPEHYGASGRLWA